MNPGHEPATPPLAASQPVSIIIPAYNEEAGIGSVLASLRRVLEAAGLVYEVVVVDDGSQDQTATIARREIGVRVLQHRENRGYGAALKTGIRHARHELVVITDADGTYPHEPIPPMVERLLAREWDMVVGARIGAHVAIPWLRRPAKWLIGRLANLVAGEAIPDLNSGLRVFRRSAALDFFDLLPDGFSFTTTITLGMITNGYLVDYFPINYHARIGRSKIRPIHDTLNFIQLILRIALYFAPLRIFLPLSGLLLLLGVTWGVLSVVVFEQLADVSTIVIVMAAIQVAATGLLAELIHHRSPNAFQARRQSDVVVELTGLADDAQPTDGAQSHENHVRPS